MFNEIINIVFIGIFSWKWFVVSLHLTTLYQVIRYRSMQKVWTPPPPSFYRQPSLFAPSFYIYFLNPLTLITIGNIAPMIYGVNANINPCGKVISSCLEDFKTLHCFFISNTFMCHTRLRFVLNLPPQLQQTPLLYRLPFSFPPFLQENLDPK